MPMFIKRSGPTYQQVPAAGFFIKPFFSNYGLNAYFEVKSGFVKTSNGYQQFFQGADARLYSFVAFRSATVSGTSFTNTSLRQGLFNNQQPSYTNFGVLQFVNDSRGISLTTALQERPVVLGATLYLNRTAAPGGGADNEVTSGNIYVGKYGKSLITGSGFSAADANYDDIATTSFSGVYIPGAGNSLITVPFSTAATALVTHMAAGLPIFFSNKNSLAGLTTEYTTTQFDTDYFWTPTYYDNFTAVLNVTLAYA